MAFGIGRGVSTPLLVINFILYLISACLAGWALNRQLDGRGVGKCQTQKPFNSFQADDQVLTASWWCSDHWLFPYFVRYICWSIYFQPLVCAECVWQSAVVVSKVETKSTTKQLHTILRLVLCRQQHHPHLLATGTHRQHGGLGLCVCWNPSHPYLAWGQHVCSCCDLVDCMASYPSRHGSCR